MQIISHAAHFSREQIVHLVDDRPSDLQLLKYHCAHAGLQTKVYDRPSDFLGDVSPATTGCLVVDMLMPEMTGLDVFKNLKRRRIHLATVIVTGFADAATCRSCFHAGVFDFIDKELGPHELMPVISRALEHNREETSNLRLSHQRRTRVSALTPRELQVANLLSDGRALKEVGAKLSISVQTASKHRSSIFEKLAVNNEVELHQVFSDCHDMLESVK